MCCVQAWRVQRGPARKCCKACSNEPAAHGGQQCYMQQCCVCGGVEVIGVEELGRTTLAVSVRDACLVVPHCSSLPLGEQGPPSHVGLVGLLTSPVLAQH